MEPKIIERGPIRLAGVIAQAAPDQVNFDAVWQNGFQKYLPQIRPYSVDKAYYGAWFNTSAGWVTSDEKERMEYLVGMAVEDWPEPPSADVVVREIPPAKYAVFSCKAGSVSQTYGQVLLHWLPTSDYVYDHAAADFEFYPRKVSKDSSPAFVYVPIKER